MADKKRFKIALSFPGGRRDYVERVASHLAHIFGTHNILYDKFHEAEFARLDLDLYLQRLYRYESELIVIFFCKDYAMKDWCGLEWRSIREIILCGDVTLVMPLRFDGADIPGFLKQDGYIWLPGQSPEETANLIVRRYRLNKDDSVYMATCNSAFKLLSSISSKDSQENDDLTQSDKETSAIANSRSISTPVNTGLAQSPGLVSVALNRSDADLRLVDIRIIDTDRSFPLVEVKLRNRGGEVAFIKRAVIDFHDVTKIPECYEYSHQRFTENWIYDLELPEVPSQVSLALSQVVEPNGVDQFSFRIGQSFGELNWPVLAHFTIHIVYNEDDRILDCSPVVLAVWPAVIIQGMAIHNTRMEILDRVNAIRVMYLGIPGIKGPRTVEFLMKHQLPQHGIILHI